MRKGFLSGVAATLFVVGFIYFYPFGLDDLGKNHGPAIAEPIVVPRCDKVNAASGPETWGSQGLFIPVLQDASNPLACSDIFPVSARLGWNKDAFLIHLEVGATQTTEAAQDNQIYTGDSVEIFFFTGPEFNQTAQIIVAPGLDPQHTTKRELIAQKPNGSLPFTPQTFVRKTSSGYALDCVLPWSAFGQEAVSGQKCRLQIVVHQHQGAVARHLGWYAGNDTYNHHEQSVPFTLGEQPSPPENILGQITLVNPSLAQVSLTPAPAALGHVLTMASEGKILDRYKIKDTASRKTLFVPLPQDWSEKDALQVIDGSRLIAELTQKEVNFQSCSQASDLTWQFESCVFDGPNFPSGAFRQDELVRRYFSPLQVKTQFYNAKYEEVTQADQPGRYGAVVTIRLPGGIVEHRFTTLYCTPTPIKWWHTSIPVKIQLPDALALNQAVLNKQAWEIGLIVKDGFVDNMSHSDDVAALLAALSETKPDAPAFVNRTDSWSLNSTWWIGLRKHLGLTETFRYLVDLPQDFAADPNKKWPLILFLHGSGERGLDVNQVRKHGPPQLIAQGKQLPAIVISPQCPPHQWWDPNLLMLLLDQVSAKYPIDPDCIYLTGLSMGGSGTWELALDFPERFAAIAPVCGTGDPLDAARLKKMPIWVFHGGKDPTVPVTESTSMVAALRQAGGKPHLTIFPEAGHDSWTQAYNTEALYTWLLAQKRGQPEVLTSGLPKP